MNYKKGNNRYAITHIDCNAYKPVQASLDFITNLVVQGSILLFDDFYCNDALNSFGERKALIDDQQLQTAVKNNSLREW